MENRNNGVKGKSDYSAIHHHLLCLFHPCVKQISVVGDSLESISKEVRLFSKQFDYVLTSGGIGPTHDDVTMEGK